MDKNQIVVPRKQIYAVAIMLGVLIALYFVGGGLSLLRFSRSQNTKGVELVAGSQEKFAFLSGQGEQRSVGST